MALYYWTVSLRPKPASLDRYGAGILVFDSVSGQAKSFIPDKKHNHALMDIAALKHVRDLFDYLERLSTETPSLPLSGTIDIPSILKTLSRDWANSIIIDEARVIAMENIDAALDILIRSYLPMTMPSERRVQKLTKIRQAVVSAYEERKKIDSLFRKKPTISTQGASPKELDFAVANSSKVFELTGAFNFASTGNLSDLQSRVEAWTWRIEQIRENGGKLEFSDNERVEVAKDAPVVAIIYPPEGEKQELIREMATTRWKELGIESIHYAHVVEHAKLLEARLPA